MVYNEVNAEMSSWWNFENSGKLHSKVYKVQWSQNWYFKTVYYTYCDMVMPIQILVTPWVDNVHIHFMGKSGIQSSI